MLKQKSKESSPLLNGGQPKLDTVEVKPVDDLIAQMEEVKAEAVAELNLKLKPPEIRRGCPCPCHYCVQGRCDLHDAEMSRMSDMRRGYGNYGYGDRRQMEERAYAEMMRREYYADPRRITNLEPANLDWLTEYRNKKK
jgi:hypothetical protein